jgi:phage terminase Nu1 subunit (DNA packaging protein)
LAISKPPATGPQGVPVSTLAQLWRCSEWQIRKYANEGIAIKLGYGRYLLLESTTNLIVHLRERAAAHQSGDGKLDIVAENAMLKATHRKLAEMKIEERAGRLISIEDLESIWQELVLAVRQLFLAFPGRARFDIPHLTGHDQEKLQRLARDMLEETALTGAPKLPARKSDDADAA